MTGPVIETAAGRLRGSVVGGVHVFRGIPYGAPTAGDARFRAPAPAVPWTGVRDATIFGPLAPQGDLRPMASGLWAALLDLLYPGYGTPLEGRAQGEDCLVLNVWTPATDNAHRPVMVWLHGGGFTSGAGSETAFHGERLAVREDIVLVTLNHRLGWLGFAPLETLGGSFEDAGVAGMLDIVAALRWVSDHIANLGGDPHNVTVFGQSGGGAKVACLLSMPVAEGLFHKAIIQSGPAMSALTQEDAERAGSELLRHTGLDADEALHLRDVSAERLLELQSEYTRRARKRAGMGVMPVVDGRVLPDQLCTVDEHWRGSHVPLLIGTNADEASMFLSSEPSFNQQLTREEAVRRLTAQYPSAVGEIRDLAKGRYASFAGHVLLSRLSSDIMFRGPTHRLAERRLTSSASVFVYRFAYETPVLDGILGATHSLELPFVFSTVDRIPLAGDRADRYQIAWAMGKAWTSFARTGSPSALGGDWPAYTNEYGQVTLLDADGHHGERPPDEVRAVMAQTRSPVFDSELP